MHIAEKLIDGRRYYYLQHSYRVKDIKTGRSKVKTSSTYLGTAQNTLERLSSTKRPLEVEHKDFGFVAALVQVSQDIGLVDLLQEAFPGERYGVPRWLYFFLTIINRLQRATSKEQMGAWAQKTILPDLYDIDPSALNSNSFWYATEDVVSEFELQTVRAAKDLLANALTTGINIEDADLEAATEVLTGAVSEGTLNATKELLSAGIDKDNLKAAREAKSALTDDLFAGIDESVFHNIVQRLFDKIKTRFEIPESATLYGTTNFFTYIDEPSRSELARTGHNKDSRHHLRQVGLALATDKVYGIPFFYRVYRANSHDSKTFGAVVDTLVEKIKATYPDVADLVLILDKGNNSKENFKHLTGKVRWVGSLVPTRYADLLKPNLADYTEQHQDILYCFTQKKIMDVDCLVVSTYRPSLARRQLYTIYAGLEKLTNEIQDKFDAYKTRPTSVPAGIKSMLKESRYGKYLQLAVDDGQLLYALKQVSGKKPSPKTTLGQKNKRQNVTAADRETEVPPITELEKAKQRLGRNLLFTDHLSAGAAWVIDNYEGKYKIEDCFALMKSADLIRFRPIRHFTDSKICAFAFCCVVALTLIKVLQLICAQSGMSISPDLIKEELTDIKAVTMIYGRNDVNVEITRRSSVQQKMWDLFHLGEITSQLPYKV